jgi:DNA-binding NarL/FixJ family response regulator
MLSLAGDMEVVAEAGTHEETVEVVSEYGLDVVLLDLEMPDVMGADESISRMLALPSPPNVVVFTMHDEPGMMQHFRERGATAYIPKSAEIDELVGAVRNAARVRTQTTGDGRRDR